MMRYMGLLKIKSGLKATKLRLWRKRTRNSSRSLIASWKSKLKWKKCSRRVKSGSDSTQYLV